MQNKLFHWYGIVSLIKRKKIQHVATTRSLRWLGAILFWTAFLTLITSFTIESSAQSLGFDANKNGLQAGVLINGGFLSQAFGALVFGCLGDRIGRYRPLIGALLFAGIGGIGTAIAWSLPMFMVFRYVQSFGIGALLPLVLTIFTDLTESFDELKQPRATLLLAAWYAWGTFFMSVIASLTLTFIGGDWGWRVLHMMGSLGMLLCVIAYDREQIVEKYDYCRDGSTLVQKSLWTFVSSPQRNLVLFLWLQWFLAYFLVTAYSNGLPVLFEYFGLKDISTLATILYGCATIVILYIFSYMFHVGGYQRWMLAGYLIVLAAVAIVGNGLLFESLPRNMLFWISTGVSLGSFLVVYGLYQTGFLFPREVRSRGLAIARGFQCLATLVAPMTTSVLYGSFGVDGLLFFWFILAFMGWVILQRLFEYRYK